MRRYGVNNAVGMLASIKPNATATGLVARERTHPGTAFERVPRTEHWSSCFTLYKMRYPPP